MTAHEAAAATDSVRKTVTVNTGAERAFQVFTTRMGVWWPRRNSIGQSPMVDVVIEPREGGKWYERSEDGSECQWGKILAWDPPGRVVFAWQINGQWSYDETLVTELELTFTEVQPGRTRVDLEHRDLDRFGPAKEGIRAAFESPDGWSGILARFAADTEDKQA